jgi:hypothetical protein
VNLGGTVLQTADHQLQCGVQGSFIDQLSPLVVQGGDTLTEAEDARRKCVLVQETLRVTLDEPRQPLPQLAQLRLDHRQGRALRGRVWLESAPVFLGQPLRMR